MNGNTENANQKGDRQQIVDLDFLRGLISAVDDSGIDSLEITRGGTRIRVAKTPPPAPAAATVTQAAPAAAAVTREQPAPSAPATAPAAAPSAPAAPAPSAAANNNWVDVKSPMVGTFYRSPSPEAPSYVEVGSHVNKGQTLCILEAMKLMNEMESEISGTVREVCVENSEPVEYGQVLFRVEPEA